MNCYKVLNIKVSDLIADQSNIPRPAEHKMFAAETHNPKLYLNKNIYEKLLELGNLSSIVFHMKPFVDKKSIHVDLDENKIPWGSSLNIILSGQGIMKWFNPNKLGVISRGNYGNVWFLNWTSDYGEQIDTWTDGKVALVRTDIPHNVWNPFDQERLIVSVRWSKKYTWEELVYWFDHNF